MLSKIRVLQVHVDFLAMHAYYVTSVGSDSVTLQTTARLAPLSIRFSRQEYWSGLPCPLLQNLPNTGTESMSHITFTSTTWEALLRYKVPQ